MYADTYRFMMFAAGMNRAAARATVVKEGRETLMPILHQEMAALTRADKSLFLFTFL